MPSSRSSSSACASPVGASAWPSPARPRRLPRGRPRARRPRRSRSSARSRARRGCRRRSARRSRRRRTAAVETTSSATSVQRRRLTALRRPRARRTSRSRAGRPRGRRCRARGRRPRGRARSPGTRSSVDSAATSSRVRCSMSGVSRSRTRSPSSVGGAVEQAVGGERVDQRQAGGHAVGGQGAGDRDRRSSPSTVHLQHDLKSRTALMPHRDRGTAADDRPARRARRAEHLAHPLLRDASACCPSPSASPGSAATAPEVLHRLSIIDVAQRAGLSAGGDRAADRAGEPQRRRQRATSARSPTTSCRTSTR